MKQNNTLLLLLALVFTAAAAGMTYLYVSYDEDDTAEQSNDSSEENDFSNIVEDTNNFVPEAVDSDAVEINFQTDAELAIGQTLSLPVNIDVTDQTEIASLELIFLYNPEVIQINEITQSEQSQMDLFLQSIPENKSTFKFSLASIEGITLSEAGELANITIERIAEGESDIRLLSINSELPEYSAFYDSNDEKFSFKEITLTIK